jgi:hypothetical protein
VKKTTVGKECDTRGHYVFRRETMKTSEKKLMHEITKLNISNPPVLNFYDLPAF